MIAFHGSHLQNLKSLAYSEETSRFGGDAKLLHGAAIYLTTDENEAKAYATGGSYYKVLINGTTFDSTAQESIHALLKEISNKANLELELLITHNYIIRFIEDLLSGKTSAVVFTRSLMSIISNDEYLHNVIIADIFEYDDSKLERIINECFNYQNIIINNKDISKWILCLNQSGDNLEILEEFQIDS